MDSNERGLKHFSKRVLTAFYEKTTTLDQVSKDLMVQFSGSSYNEDVTDERSVKRRVYEVCNVAQALDLIEIEDKKIIWRGITSSQSSYMYENELMARKARIVSKKRLVRDLIMHQLAFRRLVNRNREDQGKDASHLNISDSNNSSASSNSRIMIPAMTISFKDTGSMRLETDTAMTEAHMAFSEPFEIHDEKEILRQMRLQEFSESDLVSTVPSRLLPYVTSTIAQSTEN